ncbi:nuclear factor of activated T-cells, cytoplasmic 3-like isoform X2 [Haliotis asinina]|uniref:nuclear factor of activated T-cells, cytoplasmic 3-like isoform X2 n=1 Tax=Haliotis asinina TaxID=109174 RepID=UPI0035319921
MTMTPISNSEMLNQFLEDQVQNGSINQSDNNPLPTNLPSPIQPAAPQTLLEQDLITNLLQQSNGDQLPQSLDTQVLNALPTNCAGLQGGSQLFSNLLKPPDGSASPSNTPIQSVNLSDRSITEVLQQMLSSSQPKMPQETAQAETVPMIATTYSCTNTSNSGLVNNGFSTETVTMVTTNSITSGTFTANPPTSVPMTNTCMVNVLSGHDNLIPVKTEPSPTGCQVACDFPVKTCKASLSSATEPVNQSQQTAITTGIGNNVSSNNMKVVTSPMSGQHPRMDLPADLANVKLQMFSPVSSLASGNIGPQSVLESITNRQTNTEAPASDPPASFNQSPFTTNTNLVTTNTTNFLNVEIPDQQQAAVSSEIREILMMDTSKQDIPHQVNPGRSEHSMLRQMLTNNEVDNSSLSPSPVSSPEENVPESASSISSPNSVFHDPTSQLTLINRSAELHLQDDDAANDLWSAVTFKQDPVEADVPNKVQKSTHNSDAHTNLQSEISVEKLFDAGGAESTMNFKFTKFGQENQALFTFGSNNQTVSSSPADPRPAQHLPPAAETGSLKSMAPPIQRPRKVKDTGLGAQFPARTQQYELRIVSQPEEQHRARYLTEGSRGAVKDRSQQAHPVIKLIGHNETVCLQVFVGNETGRVKPHGFYQACKVCGKNSTPSKEKEIDGTVVIETEMTPASEMTVSVDCVGILKLRNADVEKRIGVAKARAKKKNSTRARLIFRVTFQKPDGNFQTLQVASSPIICTQPVGQPEISRMSLEEAPATGGQDLFIIGKNFLKGTQVKFQEISVENGKTLWEKEADIDQEYFQQTHLICKIPEYQEKSISKPILVQIVIHCRGKISDPQEFYYNPVPTQQVEVPMETDQNQSKNSLPCVSPVALELNRLVERTQSSPSPNTSLFQLPPGTVDGITPMAAVHQGIPTQAVQPFVKQERGSTPMETSQQQQPQHQQPQLHPQQQPQVQTQPQLQTPQQPQQQPQLANNAFGKTLLDLLNASNQPVPQNLQTGVNQPNSQIILVSNNGQTNSTAVATEAGVANQHIQGMIQSSPMIVILPGNTTNATAPVQAQATVNNIPMESILKSLLGHQTGPT